MLTDSTAITISLGLLGTIASGAGVWAVMKHRVRQLELKVARLEDHDSNERDRTDKALAYLRSKVSGLGERLSRLEGQSAIPHHYPLSPTPVQAQPVHPPIPYEPSDPD